MKVSELIDLLLLQNTELEIALRGYEGGLSTKDLLAYEQEVFTNVNKAWYYGEHEEVDDYSIKLFANEPKKVVLVLA